MKKQYFLILLVFVSLTVFSQTLKVELRSIPATAVSQCSGKAWVQVSGGTAPYKFKWNNGSTNAYVQDLCLGKYSVTVTDATDATSSDSVEFKTSTQIIIPLSIFFNSTSPMYGHCNENSGIQVSNGVAPYTFKLYNGATGELIQENTTSTYTYIPNLCAGKYYIESTDANNGKGFICSEVYNAFIGNVNFTQPMFQPINFKVAGVAPIIVTIENQNNVVRTDTIKNSDGEISYTPMGYMGIHYIKLKDNAGHTETKTFCVFDENMSIPVATNATNGCNGAIQIFGPFSNMQVQWYSSSIGGTQSLVSSNNKVENLCPGNYTVMAFDMLCSIPLPFHSVTITGPTLSYPKVDTNSKSTIYNTCMGEAWVNVSGGTPPYKYEWQRNPSKDTTEYINELCAGQAIVKVTDAANVWTYAKVNIGTTMPTTIPGDTLWTKTDTCLTNISDAYIYSYKINTYTVDVRWALVRNGSISYLDVSYKYTITLPGTYNVYLLSSCKSMTKLFASFTLSTTDINNMEYESVSLFPNPATDKLSINLDDNISTLEITDINGQKISSHTADSKQMEINIANIHAGVYCIHFTKSNGVSFVRKFVKM